MNDGGGGAGKICRKLSQHVCTSVADISDWLRQGLQHNVAVTCYVNARLCTGTRPTCPYAFRPNWILPSADQPM